MQKRLQMADETRSGGRENLGNVEPIRPGININQAGGSGSEGTEDIKGDAMPTSEPPSREEVDAKLAAAEAHLDTKISDLRGDIRVGFADMRTLIGESNNKSQNALESSQRLERLVSNTRWQLIGLAVAAVVIILTTFGIWQQGIEILASALRPGQGG